MLTDSMPIRLSVPFLLTFLTALAGAATPQRSSVRASGPEASLTLDVRESAIRAGRPFFVRLTIQNKSSSTIAVPDPIFRASFSQDGEWHRAYLNPGLIRLELKGPDGRLIKPDIAYLPEGSGHDNVLTIKSAPAESKVQALVSSWTAQGLDRSEIQARLDAMDRRRSAEGAGEDTVFLEPGKSATSVSWCSGETAAGGPSAIDCPGEGYVQQAFFHLIQTGRYRIRARRGVLTTPWAKFAVTP